LYNEEELLLVIELMSFHPDVSYFASCPGFAVKHPNGIIHQSDRLGYIKRRLS